MIYGRGTDMSKNKYFRVTVEYTDNSIKRIDQIIAFTKLDDSNIVSLQKADYTDILIPLNNVKSITRRTYDEDDLFIKKED